MPMHRIYTASGLYSAAEKKALAQAITKIYTDWELPAFYVVVLFIDLTEDSFFIGGESNRSFARFNVQHLARQFESKQQKLGFMSVYEEALKPFTSGKGIDWEVNVDDADPLVWHENGVSPPAPKSAGEKLWIQQNKAVPFDGPSFSSVL